MNRETEIGGPAKEFPRTRRSLLAGVRASEAEPRRAALDELIALYWKPVYAYVRLRWRRDNEQAKDLTQSFFAAAAEKDFFGEFDASRARFRTFLRVCVDRFVANSDRAGAALVRGGASEHFALDFDAAERDAAIAEPPDPNSLDEWFENEWRRALLDAALAELDRTCRARGFAVRIEIFRRYDVAASAGDAKPTYDALAAELGIDATAVTNHLAAARRDFRRIVLERLRAWTHDEDEFQAELRALTGSQSGSR
jgi:RNA polymerase sigma factor (sigma-70 family)